MASEERQQPARREDSSRRYGAASTMEGRRAVPSAAGRSQLAAQRAKLMSADTKVGKTRYE